MESKNLNVTDSSVIGILLKTFSVMFNLKNKPNYFLSPIYTSLIEKDSQ